MSLRLSCFLLPLLAVAAPASSQTPFTVSRHVETALTEAQFDAAMEDVNFRLQAVNDRCVDMACTARFERSGAMGIFGTVGDGLDIVDTSEDLSTVFAQDNRAKVVTALDVCGGIVNPTIVGCGRCGTSGFVVESWSTGDVYVHEYGHNINVYDCDHADWCEWSIMDDGTDGTNDSVNEYECTGFGGGALPTVCGEETGSLYLERVVTCDVTVPTGSQLLLIVQAEIQFLHGVKITADGTFRSDTSISPSFLFSASPGYPKLQILDGGSFVAMNGGQILFD